MDKTVLEKAIVLMELYKSGKLGGEWMPEDKNPGYDVGSKESYLYFTLPMALNYQRNSYKLWESAYETAMDKETRSVFDPYKVIVMSEDHLRDSLLRYKVALQKNKQPEIWRRLCITFVDDFDGDIRNIFIENNNSAKQIKEYMLSNKKKFPYLSGKKIMNYWLYVMDQYTNLSIADKEYISVAPDTNVIQASLKLNLINESEYNNPKVQEIVSNRWEEVFSDTEYNPIDIHTPLWLWSRGGFKELTI